jgi:hypothetical protein
MIDFWIVIYPWIVAGLGGFFGAALLLPTRLGDALFSYRLGKQLERFKAEQNRGLETLKEQLNHIADRGKRSNELEFSATRAVWEQFMKAYAATDAAIAGFVQAPNLTLLSEEDRVAYLEGSELSAQQRKQVLEASDSTDMYAKVVVWRMIATAREEIFLAHQTIRKERIFLQEDLRNEFMEMLELVGKACVQRQMEHQRPNALSDLKAISEFYDKGPTGVDNLAAMVRGRLLRTANPSG